MDNIDVLIQTERYTDEIKRIVAAAWAAGVAYESNRIEQTFKKKIVEGDLITPRELVIVVNGGSLE